MVSACASDAGAAGIPYQELEAGVVKSGGDVSLELRGISKNYGRKSVLAEVSHTFTPGLTLLTGPSGAGKSTLLRMIATVEKPTRGDILWNGARLPAARGKLRTTLGYAPQAVDLPEDLTAREFAMHMAALKGLSLRAADKQFGAITDAIGLHADINNRIASFSGGMRRRLIFAQALLGARRVLALDEPTAELDAETARKLGALLLERARDAIVVMTTHLADELAPSAIAVLRVEAGMVAHSS
ncbi:MAG TPA: ATP-binding cassette domain-containing protein [Vitreimonas sp.]|uniref:ATP-binding cassette domain-containing protein n=1 Tax=Vitreimonas sp. TaxID=3069702 RepID=UPI002D3D165A|nr:ATP-binding cassette domain-containing protein [Vitreimonas sp.]HYD88665.1 ATP-binding cassette domain-containing protein [Vitreimonas sp.]